MAKITVHNFLVPNIREDRFDIAKGKATEETIKSLPGCVVLDGTAEIIDDSLLTPSGRYHAPALKDQSNQISQKIQPA